MPGKYAAFRAESKCIVSAGSLLSAISDRLDASFFYGIVNIV